MASESPLHPCQNCGACCAHFRVSFHWSETLPESFGVPTDATVAVTPHRLAMRGTDATSPRCDSLAGELGRRVACTIYDRRPGPCREFTASFESGERNERCDRAREKIGLPPLTPEDYPDFLS